MLAALKRDSLWGAGIFVFLLSVSGCTVSEDQLAEIDAMIDRCEQNTGINRPPECDPN